MNGSTTYLYPSICSNISTDTDGGDGLGVTPVSDIDITYESPFTENCASLMYGILSIIALGSGAFRANIAPFGADQVRDEGPKRSLCFFNWYYWSINFGTFFALSAVTYVQQDRNFFDGFLAANICLGLSALVFLAGSASYAYRPKNGSILNDIFKVIFEACKMRGHRKVSQKSSTIEETEGEDLLEIPEVDSNSDATPTCLDYAKHRYGGSFHDSTVDDVKQLLKILLVFVTLIPYWMVYFQMQTTFQLQGLHMRLSLHDKETVKTCGINNTDSNVANPSDKSQVAVAWFSLTDVLFLIVLIPLFDQVIYPRLEKAGHPITMVTRISVGMIFATFAMLIAGIVELFRLKSVWPDSNQPCCSQTINQTIGHTMYHAADMSIFWQIPQYALIGISEVFTSVAALEFAYQMAPKSMKGIIMGFFYLFTGIGSFLGTGFLYVFSGIWFFGTVDFGNINCRLPCKSGDLKWKKSCHLDFYFFFLAVLEFIGMFVFLLVAHCLHVSRDLQTLNKQKNPQKVGQRTSKSAISNSDYQRPSINRQQSADIVGS
ncbi:hypothetical protein FSP39_001798 [Pinctada imbricata]|uniref:Solute carrier family 15 member 4 n=1 Tax=Pinctada imbricata TaxID=66713 RepID=A0AA89BJU2_PINIB|nr:hypothetical protein FSP39_001798 [Pinctada imbricata]